MSPYSGYNGQLRSCVYQPTELAIITKGTGNVSVSILLLIWLIYACVWPESLVFNVHNKKLKPRATHAHTKKNIFTYLFVAEDLNVLLRLCSPVISIWNVFSTIAVGIIWQCNSSSVHRHSTPSPERQHQPHNTTWRNEKNIYKCMWGALFFWGGVDGGGLGEVSPVCCHFSFNCLPYFSACMILIYWHLNWTYVLLLVWWLNKILSLVRVMMSKEK